MDSLVVKGRPSSILEFILRFVRWTENPLLLLGLIDRPVVSEDSVYLKHVFLNCGGVAKRIGLGYHVVMHCLGGVLSLNQIPTVLTERFPRVEVVFFILVRKRFSI